MMIVYYMDREREWGEWERVRERKESGKGVREWVGESKVKSEWSDGESEERKWRENEVESGEIERERKNE